MAGIIYPPEYDKDDATRLPYLHGCQEALRLWHNGHPLGEDLRTATEGQKLGTVSKAEVEVARQAWNDWSSTEYMPRSSVVMEAICNMRKKLGESLAALVDPVALPKAEVSK